MAEKAVAYADCMRAHGVTNYPDPGSTATGLNMDTPTFTSARAKCAKLSPLGAINTHATEQEIKQALESASCMRDHGLPNFPDPTVTTTLPTHPSGPPSTWGVARYSYDYSNGILFKIPASIVNSPAFDAAARACDTAQLFGLTSG